MIRRYTTPPWAIILGWLVTVAFLAAYDFVVHASFRGMLPAFGFEIGPFLQALFGTVVMSLFVIWLVTLAELPEMWFEHRRPTTRTAVLPIRPVCSRNSGRGGTPTSSSSSAMLPTSSREKSWMAA